MTTRRRFIAGAAALGASRAYGGAAARFGLTPVFLSHDLRLTASLRAGLEAASGLSVELVTKRTYQEITALLLAGLVDAAWICGFPYVRHRRALELLAAPVWRGRRLYRSYLICRAGRPAASLDDLRGDTHAFSDPDSNSGWLATCAALARSGETAGGFFERSFFTYGHRNVIRAVASGLAGSGSVDGYVWEAMTRTEPALTLATRVVARSEWFGFPPVACLSARRGEATVQALASGLSRLGEHEAGRTALAALQLDGFQPAPDRLYDGIAAQMAVMEAAGG